MVCDFCNGSLGTNPTLVPAAEMMAGFKQGARPQPVLEQLTGTWERLTGSTVQPTETERLFGEWMQQYRNDTTDWALCPSCTRAWHAEMANIEAGTPSAAPLPPPRRGFLARWFNRR